LPGELGRVLTRRTLIVAAALCSTLVGGVQAATARPPTNARIDVGRSMAGVRLGQPARYVADENRVESEVLDGWGPVRGFCFEGDFCGWRVPGGGGVTVILNAGRAGDQAPAVDHDLRGRRCRSPPSRCLDPGRPAADPIALLTLVS
jgi:hypothetical protein